jgi:protein-disulfide isomerase
MNRRRILLSIAGCVMSAAARASGTDLFQLQSDAGAPLTNQRVPSDLDPANLPGAVWAGSSSPDVILVEFFDYNCAFCRGAVLQLDALVAADRNLQLRLFNNAILAPGSVEAAKVQQAVLRANGPHVAYAFHKALLSIRGPADRASALETARGLGLQMEPVLAGLDLPRVAAVLERQLASAKTLDLTATPSFVVDGVEILGWPGPKEVASIVRSVRACDEPVCPEVRPG